MQVINWQRIGIVSGAVASVIAIWVGIGRPIPATRHHVAVESEVRELDAEVDSVTDSIDNVEMRADSLRRDVRQMKWMLCRATGVPEHPSCQTVGQ